jgi:hypothetical protein
MVIPTVGVFVYLLFIPNVIQESYRNYLLGLIFVSTYILPLLLLIILKVFGVIKSFHLTSIRERKIPLFIMIVLFYVLGNTLTNFSVLEDFGILFYATSFGLIAVYFFFVFKIKVSLHLLSMGIMVSFFITVGMKYSLSILPLIMVFFFLSGLLASSRLHLKAHTAREVYLGFFFGVIAQFATYYLL